MAIHMKSLRGIISETAHGMGTVIVNRVLWFTLSLVSWPSFADAQVGAPFDCVPDSTFALGPARIGEIGKAAITRLGVPLESHADTVQGADWEFPIIRYRYRDFELTVSEASGRVAEIRALTSKLHTPLGLFLGMPLAEVKLRFPVGALRDVSGKSGETSMEAYACRSRFASTIELVFDAHGKLSQLVVQGFYPNT